MSDATLQSDLAQQERARRTNEVTVLAVLAVVTMLSLLHQRSIPPDISLSTSNAITHLRTCRRNLEV